jgi:hypothetical protein
MKPPPPAPVNFTPVAPHVKRPVDRLIHLVVGPPKASLRSTKCSFSPDSSRLAISGITRVQNQWAPEGFCDSSVRSLIATRIRAFWFVDGAIAQNTVVEIASALSRDWRMNGASACITA